MSAKGNYNTKWREEIMEYMKQNEDKHLTASSIYTHFKAEGFKIGMTTVYRQLDNLVSEGLLNKYDLGQGNSACYEFSSHSEECHKNECFHCKCEICGKLIHLHCNELMTIREHLLTGHAFVLNPFRTVLYGVCSECREKGLG
ncbi:MAG: transcriptional repressor [Lachnospiraceae bacterium]|nr:transcriptional repressor [Lachnospiraceae bacterium]